MSAGERAAHGVPLANGRPHDVPQAHGRAAASRRRGPLLPHDVPQANGRPHDIPQAHEQVTPGTLVWRRSGEGLVSVRLWQRLDETQGCWALGCYFD